MHRLSVVGMNINGHEKSRVNRTGVNNNASPQISICMKIIWYCYLLSSIFLCFAYF